MKKLVYRVVPEDKTHFTWYLKLEPDDDLITQMNMECEGRSGKAIVNISKGAFFYSPQITRNAK